MTSNRIDYGNYNNSSGNTLGETVAAGSNGLLLSIVTYNPNNYTFSATWNGASMTQIALRNQGDGHYQIFFYKANPTTGFHNLVISITGSVPNYTWALTEFAGAAASQPEATVYSAAGSSSPWSVDITTLTNGAIIFGAMGIDNTVALTAGQTTDNSQYSAASVIAHYQKTTAGTYGWAGTNTLVGGGGMALISIAPLVTGIPNEIYQIKQAVNRAARY